MNPNRKRVDRIPIITGLGMKYLSDLVIMIITTIRIYENKKVMDAKWYEEFHGQATANTLRICKIAGI